MTSSKKLGQHFLINREKIKKIVEALELKNNDTIIEIGSGHGELTEKLSIINFQLSIIAIEKDEKLDDCLHKKFSKNKNIKIIKGDALKFLKPYVLNLKSYKLLGNIPYYITGYLLRLIGELESKPQLCIFTLQKEVAERIAAKPPKMNLLAASVQFWAEPKIIDLIPKTDFSPRPKVDSAVIKLTPYPKPHTLNPEHYYKFIKILFKQPRKTILNNITKGYENLSREKLAETLKRAGINPSDRPQNLDLEQIVGISEFLN